MISPSAVCAEPRGNRRAVRPRSIQWPVLETIGDIIGPIENHASLPKILEHDFKRQAVAQARRIDHVDTDELYVQAEQPSPSDPIPTGWLKRPFPVDDFRSIDSFLIRVVAAVDLLVHQRLARV